jgi:hypothetical protein
MNTPNNTPHTVLLKQRLAIIYMRTRRVAFLTALMVLEAEGY